MANAWCINAYDCNGCLIQTLQNLDSACIGVGVQYTAPNPLDDKRLDYIKYTDKCWCVQCLSAENEILIYATNGVIKNLTLTNDDVNEAIKIKWNDIFWSNRAKTIVRYKTWSYPVSITDGTLAVEETTKNQYSSTPFSLSGVLDETTYYISAFAVDSNDTIINVQSWAITTEFWYIVNEHTLIYCPLKDNINDKSWNHTMTLNTTSYWSVAKDSTWFYHFTWWYISSENYTWPTQWTISVRVKRETKTTWDTTLQRWLTNTYKNSAPYYNMAFEFNKSRYTAVWNWNTTYFRNIWASLLEERELRTMTYSPSEWWKMYRNAVLVDSFSSNQNLRQYNWPTFIWWSNYTSSWRPTPWSQYFKWYLSDVIMEDKARTQSEIQDYFNKMKSKYWIS